MNGLEADGLGHSAWRIERIDRISDAADGYDLVLLDQWGVLHDGAKPRPGALEALQEIRRAGRPVILISNSSKRSAVSEAGLATLGFERSLYDHVVTSGELGWQAIKARSDPFYVALGRRCVLFTWQGDRRFLDGLDLEEVGSYDEADFVLLAGTTGVSVAEYEPELAAVAARRLPMVCLNRDLVSVDPDGRLVDCSGKLARRYEELGGTVRYYGKPGREIFEACLALAPTAKRPIMIGDSLYNDIAGANGIGIDSVLVTGGIHAFDLGVAPEEAASEEVLSALCARIGAWPTFAIPDLRW